jgi:hypothetical protein
MLEHVDIKFNAVLEGTLQPDDHFLKWNPRHMTVWWTCHFIFLNGRPCFFNFGCALHWATPTEQAHN